MVLASGVGSLPGISEKKIRKDTLPETNSSHLKMDGWNTIVSIWDDLFSEAMSILGRVDSSFFFGGGVGCFSKIPP